MAAYVAKTAREMADADLRSEFSKSHVNDLRFKQVFANLINNAVKFSSREPTECLDYLRLPDGGFCIVVRDEGEGMSKDDINFSVTRFGQVSNKKRAQEGTGLGLPLSIGLVENYGATLDISSAP